MPNEGCGRDNCEWVRLLAWRGASRRALDSKTLCTRTGGCACVCV